MRHENGMVCIITTKGAIFSDKERLDPENIPEKAKKGMEREKNGI